MTTRSAAQNAPSSRPTIDLRHLLPTLVPEQGPRPVCLPISVTGAHDALCSGSGQDPRAAEALWWSCVNNGTAQPEGTTLAAVTDVLGRTGQPSDADWPFNAGLGVGTEKPPFGCAPPPWRIANSRQLVLARDGVEDLLEDQLALGLPIVVVLEITDEFEIPDPNGYVVTPQLNSPVGDYHAALVVGAHTDTLRGRLLLVRNSWGVGWGLGGYCWLPIDYLVSFAVQAAVVLP